MRELPERKRTRLPSFDYSTAGAYFLTLCTENRRCILSHVVAETEARSVGTGVPDGPSETGSKSLIKLLPWGKVAEKYLLQLNAFYDDLSIDAYVIMPNHIHLLVSLTQSGPSGTPVPTKQNSTISRFISTFKRFCNKEYGKNIWQDRSYDHVIRSEKDYETHLQYIYENPFSWQEDRLYTNQ